jgi:hypothetical protein
MPGDQLNADLDICTKNNNLCENNLSKNKKGETSCEASPLWSFMLCVHLLLEVRVRLPQRQMLLFGLLQVF